MVNYIVAIFSFCAALFLSSPLVSYADTATRSDASCDLDDVLSGLDPDMILDEDTLYYLQSEGLLDGDIATASDATLDQILLQVAAIRAAVSPTAEDQEDQDAVEVADDVVLVSDSGGLPDHDVVLLRGSFKGTDYTVVCPADLYRYLYIDDNGVLYNISSNNITCRMFEGGVFDPTDYNYDNLILYPVLGTSANNLYRYGALSYRQYYYKGTGSSLTSSTEYGYFYVDDVEMQRSLGVDYRIYYALLFVFFMMGVNVLCSYKNLRH